MSIDGGITTGAGTIEAVCLINLNNYEAEFSLMVASFAVQSLDIQYTAGLTTNVSTTFHSVGDSSVQGFLDYATFLAGQNPSPSVVTVSYGFTEPGFQSSPNLAKFVLSLFFALSESDNPHIARSVTHMRHSAHVALPFFSPLEMAVCPALSPTRHATDKRSSLLSLAVAPCELSNFLT